MNSVTKALDRVDLILAYLAGIVLLFMMTMVFLDSVLRTTINSPIVGGVELVGEYLLPIIVYFSISYTLKFDGHVSVDFLKNKFPHWLAKIFRVFYNILALIIFIILGMNNFEKALEFKTKGVKSIGMLDYPLYPALFIITIGIFVLAIRLIVETINIVRGKKEG